MATKRNADIEQSLSFLSKSWLKAQKEVKELDFKLVNQTMQSFNDLASSFNREWESFRKTSLTMGDFQTSEWTLVGLKESWPRAATDFQTSEWSFVKLKESWPRAAMSGTTEDFAQWSMSPFFTGNAANSEEVTSYWKPLPPKQEFFWKALAKGTHKDARHCKESVASLIEREPKLPMDWKEIKKALQDWQKSREGKQKYSLQEWEPLRRLRVSLIELETTAAASRSPKDFFENVKKMEFFENTKKNLSIPIMTAMAERGFIGGKVAPLELPELLESLVRQSQPLLDHLGVKKGFEEMICSVLRSWKYHENSFPHSSGSENDIVMLSKEAGIAVNELDSRLASVLDSTAHKFHGEFWGWHPVMREVRHPGKRSITIATTASLPWMTGTAINPLLRAAYLTKNGERNVTLLIPWLSKKDQRLVYPDQMTFNSPQEQEKYIREWLHSRISFQPEFKIVFYPGKFSESKRSILAVDDITVFIPQTEADIAILEEPEHLTWYHHGARWTQKFRYVVGIVHTNYLEYVKREKNGPFQAFLLKYVNNWVTNIYCHKVIRLSAATQTLPKSIICNVHGVSPKFLQIGQAVAEEKKRRKEVFTHGGAYFLGKMVWGKGYRELLDLWALHKDELNELWLDVFGNGEDAAAVKEEGAMRGLQMKFHEGKDHADSLLQGYKVFINPSVSDVVCTTTAEALAMGKIVVCADHPSNEFFKDFPNCHMYRSSGEFVKKVKEAMSSVPLPLSLEQQHMLSWEAATERFLRASELDELLEGSIVKKARKKRHYLKASVSRMGDAFEYGMFLAHYCLSGIEIARLASGAIPGTMHMDKEQQQDLGLV
ncbi:hypothetical protein GOP47_0000154 [Adiantum capillus-veneris]|uniref:digalactosyldiacylglycerol synthase n=1 Tax=Adiantum capillus-veneris TaxID=13818 RepID=A0A9D4VCI3_ADICA|nr:hypothetical protein GOP47_0000154 [Adiantum capillus-veneris]